MLPERPLPRKRNPLLAPENTPDHDELIQKRRLGQTHLSVKPGLVGTSNATKAENLGMIDYAHLRAPLPPNLKGSEIFAPQQHQSHPDGYFLMRRSSDGYISATGMFKASFPWAKYAEETLERDYVKSLTTTSEDEIAGNVWITESYALVLAEEYGITPWILALLDEAPVAKSTEDPKKSISPPPKYTFTANDKTLLPPPTATPRGRGRPRASSPIKNSTPGGKAASPRPRKPRATKATNAANAATAREASASLQAALDNAASVADSESVDDERVKVEVESVSNINGDGEVETEETTVRVKMPAGTEEFPFVESAEEMISKAKEMVEEARKLEGEASGRSRAPKRKADKFDDDEDEEADKALQPAKKARLLEQELKTQKVRTRAVIGIAATLAIGAMIPYVL